MRDLKGYDIIGDVHACWEELLDLIGALGYVYDVETGVLTKPKGRNLAFVGDVVDRGPDSAKTLEIVMNLQEQGCIVLLGNHCYELLLCLRGKRFDVAPYLQRTLDQIRARGPEFEKKVVRHLRRLPFAHEDGDLIIVHAGYRKKENGSLHKKCALYGQYIDENGNLSYDGYTNVTGSKTIVHGHFAGKGPEVIRLETGPRMVNVDSGCCFGHQLTALCFPEMFYKSIPARMIYRF
jgi:protein phosphatase